jgi:hypothetical protein
LQCVRRKHLERRARTVRVSLSSRRRGDDRSGRDALVELRCGAAEIYGFLAMFGMAGLAKMT